MNDLQMELIAYGLDNITANNIIKKHSLSQLKKMDIDQLIQLGISEYNANQILSPNRTPIPKKTADNVLIQSAFTCCICRKNGLPIVIHHIDKWAHSHSHEAKNLCVLCQNHHADAHTHRETSQNFTPDRIRKAKKEWCEIVAQRGLQEKEDALGNLQRYTGRWDYFNLNYIYGHLSDHNLTFSSRYENGLITKGLLLEDKTVNSEKLTTQSTHWLNFFDGQFIKLYIEEMVNTIINSSFVYYLTESNANRTILQPGDLCLIDGRFYFKQMNKKSHGIGQMRRAQCTLSDMKFIGEFDAWYCTSSSSYGEHLSGCKHATQLCLIRSIENAESINIINCTIIGLGLNLTQPDFMSLLMENVKELSASPHSEAHEKELDQIVDLQYGNTQKEYFSPPPETCDICHVSFKNKKYMIDGAIRNNSAWACMCSKCYQVYGKGIEWGVGQLYLHQENQWLLVGGFSEHDDDEINEDTLLQLMNSLIDYPTDKRRRQIHHDIAK